MRTTKKSPIDMARDVLTAANERDVMLGQEADTLRVQMDQSLQALEVTTQRLAVLQHACMSGEALLAELYLAITDNWHAQQQSLHAIADLFKHGTEVIAHQKRMHETREFYLMEFGKDCLPRMH